MKMKYKLLVIILLSVFTCLNAQLQDMFNLNAGAVGESEPKKETTVSVMAMHDTVGIDQATVLAIIIDVTEDEHLYANPNTDGIGLPTILEVEPVEGLEFGKPVYPTGQEYKDLLGNIDMVYVGQTVLYLPVKNVSVTTESEIPVKIKLDGQICTEGGQCIRWDNSSTYNLKIDPAISEPVMHADSGDVFASIDPDSYFAKVQPGTGGMDNDEASQWVIVNILFAMLAGFIMNFMPCVLPVIPLKVLSIIKQGQQAKESGDNYKAFKLSLVFAAGIILLFAVLGLVLSGFSLAYGQQFQNFTFKLSMFLLVYIMALSMFGLFEIVLPASVSNIGVVKDGYLGSFMMGVMATLLATPCSAPFLGGILFWALNESAMMTLVIFISIGIGMSAPYVVLTAFPKLIDRMPTAGSWMLRLKEGLAFVMLGVVVYMSTWFKANEIAPLLALCVAIAFGLWLSFKVVNFTSPTGKKAIVRLIAIAVIALTGYLGLGQADEAEAEEQVSFSEIVAAKEQALTDGQIVFMEFTADWCPNCKYVEKTVIKTDAFQDKLKETNAVFLLVDWTEENPEIKAELNRLGSKSVPFTAVFHPENPNDPILLRDIYTLQSALDALGGNR